MKITSKPIYRKACRSFAGIIASLFLLLSSADILASGGEESKKFNAGEMIIHHISDAHSIHFFGNVSIPLPCIVKTDAGWDCFMSSVFMNEHHEPSETYHSATTGNVYALHHEKIYIVSDHGHQEAVMNHDAASHVDVANEGAEGEHMPVAETAEVEASHEFHGTPVTDFSITKSVLGMLVMLSLVVFVFTRVAKSYKKRKGMAPKGMQNLLEPLILFIKDEVAIPALGKKKAMKYLPFLLTMFFFIWSCNMLGLIPFMGGFNITGTLSITMVMAALVFVITTVSGNAHYWGHIVWPPGVPFAVKIILVPIEIASVFIKPTVLMIRLTANINAGHIVILALTSLIFIFGEKSAGAGYGVGVAATLFIVFMFFIELLVAFLQAYVFTLLAALYFGDASQEHHHEEKH